MSSGIKNGARSKKPRATRPSNTRWHRTEIAVQLFRPQHCSLPPYPSIIADVAGACNRQFPISMQYSAGYDAGKVSHHALPLRLPQIIHETEWRRMGYPMIP